MALDRSKFKATSIAAAQKQDEEIKASLGKNNGGFTGYLKLDDVGPDPKNRVPNIIRIYPPHPEEDGGGDVFAEPKVTVFLPMMVPERDQQGNEMLAKDGRPVLKEGVKSVFNARIHGNLDYDLVEEYIRIALERLEEAKKATTDKAEIAKISGRITQILGDFKSNVKGLKYIQKWALYADKIVGETKTFGTLEIGPAVKDRLNQIAAAADSGDKALSTDPFTDIEEGKAVFIYYNKDAKKSSDYYQTEIDPVLVPTQIAGRTYNLPRTFPLTDDQLEAFMKVEPLAKRFKGVFSRRDLELQVEGLQYFDNKHGIGLFEDQEFLEVYQLIDEQVPEVEEEAAEGGDEEGQSEVLGAETITQYDEPDQDMFDLMDRKELGDWHRTNKSGVLVKPTITDDVLREKAREHLASLETGNDEEEEEGNENPFADEDENFDEEGQSEVEQTTEQTTKPLSKLEQMKLKAGVKKAK